MIPQDGYTDLVVARLMDFVHRRSPWQRRLWRVGLPLSLQEVAEYGELVEQGLRDEGLRYVVDCVRHDLASDLGVRDPLREALLAELSASKLKSPDVRERLLVLAGRVERGYLQTWRTAASRDSDERAPIEHVGRALSSFLLDAGFSPDHLHRWLRATETSDDTVSLAELIDAAQTMWQRGERGYSVLVPFEQLPDAPVPDGAVLQRLNDVETRAWLERARADTSNVRYSASLLFDVAARDPWAAVDRVAMMVARLQARAAVGHPGTADVTAAGVAYLDGKRAKFSLAQPRREVEVHSVTRQHALLDIADYRASGNIDDALELAATLEHGSPGAAIAGGWAAIEGLLARQGPGEAPQAADRLASLVAASWPRAELTTLSYRHAPEDSDQLAEALTAIDTNRDRSLLIETHLREGHRLALRRASDRAAEARMVELLADPGPVLQRVRDYVRQTVRRLYNQRNLVMHGGSLRSVALEATLRTAPPLVGAGLDRIVHAALESRGASGPHELVARADVELRLAETDAALPVSELLERHPL